MRSCAPRRREPSRRYAELGTHRPADRADFSLSQKSAGRRSDALSVSAPAFARIHAQHRRAANERDRQRDFVPQYAAADDNQPFPQFAQCVRRRFREVIDWPPVQWPMRMIARAAPHFEAQSLAACPTHVDYDMAFARRGRNSAGDVDARIVRGGDRNDGTRRARDPALPSDAGACDSRG